MSVQPGLTATRIDWSIATLTGEDPNRPRQGSAAANFTCPRCRRGFRVTVENSARARTKRWIYVVVGVVLLLSLLYVVPQIISIGGQTVDENDPNATDGLGLLLLYAVFAFIAGLTYARYGWSYVGIKKFRRVAADGKNSVLAKGHRLF
ncbi:hypothetical protein [Kitasatospora albolonga]|uniref:hypothetical protein n=1 Tax=Kitasatospora albolonga TaxID=68173 RepID=UPI0035E8267A